MKNLIVFIVGVVVGVLLCYKFGYDYLSEQLANNMTMIVDQVMTNGVGTGGQHLLNQYQGQAEGLVEEQKAQLKEEIKKQLTDYITKKVDGAF